MSSRHWRNHAATFTDGTDPNVFPCRETLRMCVTRLLTSIELDEDFLGLAIETLSAFGKESLLSVMFSHCTSDEIAVAERLLSIPGGRNPDRLASLIMGATVSPANPVTSADIRDKLAELLDRESTDIPLFSKFEELARIFHLRDADMAVISVALCYMESSMFESFCDRIPYPIKFRFIAKMTGNSVAQVMKASGRQGALVRCGIMEPLDPANRHCFYALNADVAGYLAGLIDGDLMGEWCRRVTDARFPVDGFDLSRTSRHTLVALLRSGIPLNILLYGAPGTGKTEYAKAISAAVRKPAYFVRYGEQGENKDRRIAIEAAANTLSPQDAVLVVDEADGFLNTRYAFAGLGSSGDTVHKCWLNDFLENQCAQVIWITNDVRCIEESTRRRFAYSVEFKPCTVRQREQLWAGALRSHPLRAHLDPRQASDLARRYRVNAAGISGALSVAAQSIGTGEESRELVVDTLKELLASHERLAGTDHRTVLSDLGANYDPGVTHADADMGVVLRSLRAHITRLRDDRPALNLLFWGIPGTGKTACAKYLAREAGMELIVKRASDLLNMFVGGTEHNIREAFEEAEREEAILLLDEADSFFIDRRSAHHSWESSQTNELLTQIENHRGIVICCTNLLEHLDDAAARRFAWKIQFRPLTDQGRLRLYRKLFTLPGRRLTSRLRQRLLRIQDLTPGDMQIAWERRVLSDGNASHARTVEDLEREARSRWNLGLVGFRAG